MKSKSVVATPYVRFLDRVGGMGMIRSLDEGEQLVMLESGHIGHLLSQYCGYLLAIVMAAVGEEPVRLWSVTLIALPAVTQTVSGMYAWYKRRTLGLARLSTRRQMLAGLPVLVLCLVWLAVFTVRLANLSTTFKATQLGVSAVLMVVLTFVIIRLAHREQERIDHSLEDDDEF